MDEKEGLRETFLCMGSSVRGQAQLSARVFWNPGRSTDHISYVWGIYTSLFPTLSSRVASYIEHLTSRLPEWHFFMHTVSVLWGRNVSPVRVAEVLSNRSASALSSKVSPSSLIWLQPPFPLWSSSSVTWIIVTVLAHEDWLGFTLLWAKKKKCTVFMGNALQDS